ncbi:MAG TPA: ABC transporter permease [Candidatus Acidoferrales bacterium]|nr:ABC transporter permease [Candidatus Acidoferrales bacterium]
MRIFEDAGRETIGFFEYVGGVAELLGDATHFIGRFAVRGKETFDQAYLLGVNSWTIVLLTALFTGAVISLESAVQAVRYGFSAFVGSAVAYGTVRELGPMLTAVVVAGRAGAAIAAELGSMVVTEQVEALEALGLSPTRMLVVPRLIALVIMLPLLTIFAEIVAIIGGMWVAYGTAHIPFDSFLDSARQVEFLDVIKGLGKTVVFAIIIVMIGTYQGFRTTGGAAGVGKSTTSAVVTAIILIFLFNFMLSFVLFGG